MRGIDEAAGALEGMLIKQILKSSRAFGGSDAPGADIQQGFFMDAMAQAIVDAGGFGLADQIKASLGEPSSALSGRADSQNIDANASLVIGLPGTADADGLHDLTRAMYLDASPSLDSEPLRHDSVFRDIVADPEARISSRFGYRADPFTGDRRFHAGMDIAAPEGAPIMAASDGVVRWAGERGNFGVMIEIEHPDRSVSRYAHASEAHVEVGQRVRRGEVVAEIGSTGRATGSHLHFEVRVRGKVIDPERALKVYSNRVDSKGAGQEVP